MATNHYLLSRPAVISFSGGRTSGYMLWHILQAFGGTLPDDVKAIFCNTGKEREETLEFVERCSQQWNVPVTWLEYDQEPRLTERKKTRNGRLETPYIPKASIVDYASASRNGEPLMKVIKARNMLPNVMARFCTVECKIRTTKRYLKSLGWDNYENAIGFRADEPQRVAIDCHLFNFMLWKGRCAASQKERRRLGVRRVCQRSGFSLACNSLESRQASLASLVHFK